MVLVPVKCPRCGSAHVRKNGTAKTGKQKYRCFSENCPRRTFVESYPYKAYAPYVRPRIFFLIINDCGTRAAARALGIARDTVADC
jgi:transposase-like protein